MDVNARERLLLSLGGKRGSDLSAARQADWRSWAYAVALVAPDTRTAAEQLEIGGWPAGWLEQLRVGARLKEGYSIEPEVTAWTEAFRDRAAPFGTWKGDVAGFWLSFFTKVGKTFYPPRHGLEVWADQLFRREPRYKERARELLRTTSLTWPSEWKAEVAGWPDGARDDMRVVMLLSDGETKHPEVEAWVVAFARQAWPIAIKKYRLSAQDALERVQAFWPYLEEKKLYDKYSPALGRWDSYCLRCFANEVLAWLDGDGHPPGGLLSIDDPISPLDLESGEESVLEVLLRTEADGTTRARAEAAIAGLPPRQREALRLRYAENKSYAEIGRVLGLDANAARQLTHNARRSFRRRWLTADS